MLGIFLAPFAYFYFMFIQRVYDNTYLLICSIGRAACSRANRLDKYSFTLLFAQHQMLYINIIIIISFFRFRSFVSIWFTL